jgi:hypothetical protein
VTGAAPLPRLGDSTAATSYLKCSIDEVEYFGHRGFVRLLGRRGPKQIHIGEGAPILVFGGTKFLTSCTMLC